MARKEANELTKIKPAKRISPVREMDKRAIKKDTDGSGDVEKEHETMEHNKG